MKNRYLLSFSFFFLLSFAYGSWQDKQMKRIDRQIRNTNSCKCLSKTQEIDDASVKFYFTPKKVHLVRIIEKRNVNGATVFTTFYFDKKKNLLISVNQGVTVFYYQESGYFAVLSSDNFSADDAKANSEKFSNLAQKYISKLK